MKFQIGYQNNRKFVEYLLKHSTNVSELYFPWEKIATGRGVQDSYTEQRQLEADLELFSRAGIKLCLLMNGNCYGRRSFSRNFFQYIGDTVDFIGSTWGLEAVTTASPLIAKFLRTNFPKLKIRASVNMEIGTPEAVEYVADLFDSFYLKREYNNNFNKLEQMRDFCHSHGKLLFLLANSGCINFCSARTFHDNLVAHQNETAEMDNAFTFHSLCSTFLKTGQHRNDLLFYSNFIRPEDVSLYKGLCDGMKIATRTNFNPLAVATAYFSGIWNGNLLDLTEPAHSELFYPQLLDNGKIPANYGETRLHLTDTDAIRRYCADIQRDAMVKLDIADV